jgi:hypothetical protein
MVRWSRAGSTWVSFLNDPNSCGLAFQRRFHMIFVARISLQHFMLMCHQALRALGFAARLASLLEHTPCAFHDLLCQSDEFAAFPVCLSCRSFRRSDAVPQACDWTASSVSGVSRLNERLFAEFARGPVLDAQATGEDVSLVLLGQSDKRGSSRAPKDCGAGCEPRTAVQRLPV